MSVRLFWCNVFCVLIAVSAVWANYHIVEQTRVLNVTLRQTSQQIQNENADLKDTQVTYVALSRPGRIQQLAEALLGMHDGATYQVASFQMIPVRGESENSGDQKDGDQKDGEQQISDLIGQSQSDASVVKISAPEGR